MTLYYHCGECDQVVDKKYAKNHPKGKLSYLFATDDKEKEKKVDDIAQDETDEEKEEKKKEKLESLKAELRGKSHEELDKIKEDLTAQIEELKKKKTESKEASTKRYDVLAYDTYHLNSKKGDCFLEELGSTD